GAVQSLLRRNYSGDERSSRRHVGLAFLGRHSLVVYLVHQPVLISLLFVFSLAYPPDLAAGFVSKCEAECDASLGADFCMRFCGCALDELREQDLFAAFQSGTIPPGDSERIEALR